MMTTRTYHEGDEPVPGAGYRLVHFLGRGGFGEVWKAIGPGGAEAALKIIRFGSAEGRKEFRALQLVKRIRHPNLMPLMGFWLKTGEGAILDHSVTEHLELADTVRSEDVRATMVAPRASSASDAAELIIAMGLGDKSLFDRLQECRTEGMNGIPQDELIGYMEDAAEAIDFLNRPIHDSGNNGGAVQHCDIKPHNLMIVGGAVQVCDFGLARMMGADRTTTVGATIAYAAPECLEKGKPSGCSDQYSLAVTYYELRTGMLPYFSETLTAVLEAKSTGKLDLSGLPQSEQAVLQRALNPNPEERYTSAGEMVKELRKASLASPQSQQAAGSPRGSKARALKALIPLLLLGGIVAAGWQLSRRAGEGRQEDGVALRQEEDGKTSQIAAKEPPVAEDLTAKESQPSTKTTQPPPPKPTAEMHLAAGTKSLEQGDYDRAIAELSQAILLDPQDFRSFSRRGTAWFQTKEYQKAADDFTAAIRISPDARDYVNRGRVLRQLERLPDAIADFTGAIRLDPENAAAYYFRGDIHLRLEKNQEAVADLTQAIRLSTFSPNPLFALADAYTFRGSAHLLMDQADDAASDFSAALRLDPEDRTTIHQLRAAAYESKGRDDWAKYDLEIADHWTQLKKAPDDPAAHRKLVSRMLAAPDAELRDGRKAVELANQACELGSWENPADLDLLAAAHAEIGQFPEAIQWAKKAVELAPDGEAAKQYQSRLENYEKRQAQRHTLSR